MTKPKRFEPEGEAVFNTNRRYVPVEEVARLRRKDHTAMVRQVRRMLTRHSEPDDACDYTNGYCQACDDFLAWLQGRR